MSQNGNGGERRVWERVAPSLEAYPAAGTGMIPAGAAVLSVTGEALRGAELTALTGTAPPRRPERPSPPPIRPEKPEKPSATPGRPGKPPFDTAAELAGMIEAERSNERLLHALARSVPAGAGQTAREAAGACGRRARRLAAAYYMETGRRYAPARPGGGTDTGATRPDAREACRRLAQAGGTYARAAERTPDPFLGKLFRDLSAGAYRNASDLLRLLER